MNTLEPIIGYCRARCDQLSTWQNVEASAARAELEQVIVLCEGLIKQEKLILSALKPTTAQLAG